MRKENPKEAGEGVSDKDITMSRWLFEGAMARLERSNKRLFILTMILIILLFASNIGWAIYEAQFEDVEIMQESEDGDNHYNYVGNDGDITNYAPVKE